jgi:hypothetical protein
MIIFFFGKIFFDVCVTRVSKGRSTVTILIEFTPYVLHCMEKGVHVQAFSKAFDKVSHRLLLRKLTKLRFDDSVLAWIGSYLTGCEQFVKASGSQSRKFSVRSGVPQSSQLGSLLFILFINDIYFMFQAGVKKRNETV